MQCFQLFKPQTRAITGFLTREPSEATFPDTTTGPLLTHPGRLVCLSKTCVDLILVSSTCINKPLTAACYWFSSLVPVGQESWGSFTNTVCFSFFPFVQNRVSRIHAGAGMCRAKRLCPGMSWHSESSNTNTENPLPRTADGTARLPLLQRVTRNLILPVLDASLQSGSSFPFVLICSWANSCLFTKSIHLWALLSFSIK